METPLTHGPKQLALEAQRQGLRVAETPTGFCLIDLKGGQVVVTGSTEDIFNRLYRPARPKRVVIAREDRTATGVGRD